MRLTVVGCWSPYPAPGSACSAYLVESDQTALLLDCGHGAMAQLFTYIKPERLNGVVITHSHPDHYNDLPALRHYWRSRRFLGQKLPPLPVWFPPGDKESQRWLQVPELEVKAASGVDRAGNLELEFWEGQHAIPTCLVKIKAGNQSLLYTGDTAYSEKMIAASRGSDLVVAECTLPPSEAHLSQQLGHLTWEECGRWGTRSETPRLVATHLWPEYDREEIRQAVAREYQGSLMIAEPGMVVEW
ncbi:MAG: MBL fold metallo-hydrolase [Methylocystaceae bacterium]